MKEQELYITSACAIYGGTISKNGSVLFANNEATDAVQFFISAYKYFAIDYPRFYKMDNLCKLGVLAVEMLLHDTSFKSRVGDKVNDVAILFLNASSSLDTDKKYFKSLQQMASPALFVYTLPNIVMGEICIRHGFKGENVFLIEESFNAVFLQQQVTLLLNTNANSACICGWVEFLENEYKAFLYLVEKDNPQGITFTAENLSIQ